jgi:small GTP-binding protein
MGSSWSSFMSPFYGWLINMGWMDFKCRVIFIGLDCAGKTTILYKKKLQDENIMTTPTLGFNVENIQVNNIQLTVWDIGGQTKFREQWKHYYQNCDALIFVVDSSDQDRFPKVREALHEAAKSSELSNVPLLIFANKQDLPKAMEPSELSTHLNIKDLPQYKNGCIHVQGTIAKRDEGLDEGLQWLSKQLKNML